jgi:hypothetical protein
MTWTAPRTWTAAEVVTAALLNTHVRDNFAAIGNAWTPYTPAWTSSGTAPAIGNGTIVGAWISVGKLTIFRAVITMDTTTTYGTGTYSISLPATVDSASGRLLVAGIARDDSATADFPIGAIVAGGATTAPVRTWPTSAAGAALIGINPTIPFSWGVNDSLTISGTYEAA